MHPLLFLLGELPVRSYGAFVGAALVAGMSVVVRYGRRAGLPGDRLLDVVYASVIAGLIGGRIMYIVVHAPDFVADPVSMFKVWEGGMMYFGGLVMGVAAGAALAWRMKLDMWRSLDSIAPAMGAGQAVGRVACLVAGCCYGREWNGGGLSIAFHDSLAAVPVSLLDVPLIPTQVLQIAEGLLLWGLGAWLFRRRQWDGQAFAVTFGAAGITRALLEELRGDPARGFLMPGTFGEALPSSRVVGIAMVVAAIAIWVVRTHRAANLSGASTTATRA